MPESDTGETVTVGTGVSGVAAGDEVFPLLSAREAFARSLEPGRRGKVVLAVA